MLIGLDSPSAVEPVCPAVIEASAIVEAEWIRLRRPSGPAQHATRELLARRRYEDRARAGVTTAARPGAWSIPDGELAVRRPSGAVWPRQRSPPLEVKRTVPVFFPIVKGGGLRELRVNNA